MVRLMLAELPTWATSLAARLLEALVALIFVEVAATELPGRRKAPESAEPDPT